VAVRVRVWRGGAVLTRVEASAALASGTYFRSRRNLFYSDDIHFPGNTWTREYLDRKKRCLRSSPAS